MRPTIVTGAALALVIAVPVPAQEPAAPPPWEETNRQLERIADLLERHLEGRKIDLLTRRVEVSASRLQPIVAELASLESGRVELVSERRHVEGQIEETADQIASGALDVPQDQIDLFARDMERRMSRIDATLEERDRRIAELEAERARLQREIDDWQAYLDRELSGL